MKIKYIFCAMCLILLAMPSFAIRGRMLVTKTLLERRAQQMLNKSTAQNWKKQMGAATRPPLIIRSHPFGRKLLNAVRTSMGVPAIAKDGNINPFVQNWDHLASKVEVQRWSAPLMQKYPKGQFNSYVVQNLSTVDALTGTSLFKGKSAPEALKMGLERAEWAKEGYLVVVVKGNKNHLKDILVMDHENGRWLSVNGSKGRAIARNFEDFSKQVKQEREAAPHPLEQQGVWMEPVGARGEESQLVRMTDDGLVWRNFDAGQGIGAELKEAWNGNYYIRYYPHEHKALYAVDKDSPLFTSTEEVNVAYLAEIEGLRVMEVDHHPVVLFEDKMMPNVLLKSEEGLVPLTGQAVTADVYSYRDVITLVQDLKDISEELAKVAPAKKIVYTRPITEGKYQRGQIEQYISDFE